MLDANATYLGQLGENVTDVSQLWQFAIMQVAGLSPAPVLDNESDISVPSSGPSLDFNREFANQLATHYSIGPLGDGWSDNWQYSLSVGSDGTVSVTMPSGINRVFQPDSRGTDYFSEPGDGGILTQVNDNGVITYSLLETDGTIEAFNADGTLNYVQDAHGNRITAGYSNGQLASLASSSGGSLTLTYNPAGLIQTVSGSNGQSVTYIYDSTNTHLLSARHSNGQTYRYVYDNGSNPAVQNALASITYPDGSHRFFTYSTTGRLATMSDDDGIDELTFGYREGEVTVSDAAGDISAYYYDDSGNLVKYVDPMGNASYATYNSNGEVTSLIGPTGLTSSYTYDSRGNLTNLTNPLGQTSKLQLLQQ